MGNFTVGTVSWYSSELIAGMLRSLEQTAVERTFQCIIADNTAGEDGDLYERFSHRCRIIPLSPPVPPAWRARSRAGSYAHGFALNHLFSQLDTETALFIDPDCLVLMRGWDQEIIRGLQSRTAIGAPYHTRKIPKYHNFPSPIFIAFDVERLRQLGPDWTPYQLSAAAELGDQLRRAVALLSGRIGENLAGGDFHRSGCSRFLRRYLGNSSKDTGWRLARAAARLGVDAELFTPATHADQLAAPYREIESLVTLLHEFELFLWNGEPVFTHFYGNLHRKRGSVPRALDEWQKLGEEAVAQQ